MVEAKVVFTLTHIYSYSYLYLPMIPGGDSPEM